MPCQAAQPWKGLGTDLGTLVAILRENKDEWQATAGWLEKVGLDVDGTERKLEWDGQDAAEPAPSPQERGRLGGRGRKALDNVKSFAPTDKGGNDPDYLISRIKRDRPDVAARYEAGEFKSVHAAAKEAGIVRPADPVKQLSRCWERAPDDARDAFLGQIMHRYVLSEEDWGRSLEMIENPPPPNARLIALVREKAPRRR